MFLDHHAPLSLSDRPRACLLTEGRQESQDKRKGSAWMCACDLVFVPLWPLSNGSHGMCHNCPTVCEADTQAFFGQELG